MNSIWTPDSVSYFDIKIYNEMILTFVYCILIIGVFTVFSSPAGHLNIKIVRTILNMLFNDTTD